jgi:hypothetical protein
MPAHCRALKQPVDSHNPAVVELTSLRPVTLRPYLSTGLPLLQSVTLITIGYCTQYSHEKNCALDHNNNCRGASKTSPKNTLQKSSRVDEFILSRKRSMFCVAHCAPSTPRTPRPSDSFHKQLSSPVTSPQTSITYRAEHSPRARTPGLPNLE